MHPCIKYLSIHTYRPYILEEKLMLTCISNFTSSKAIISYVKFLIQYCIASFMIRASFAFFLIVSNRSTTIIDASTCTRNVFLYIHIDPLAPCSIANLHRKCRKYETIILPPVYIRYVRLRARRTRGGRRANRSMLHVPI